MGSTEARLTLSASGPVAASADGQVFANLEITVDDDTAGIEVGRYEGVTIRHCLIRHASGPGIEAVGSTSLLIEDCEIICTKASSAGPLDNAEAVNLKIDGCATTTIRRVRVERGASGIWAHRCAGILISMLEGHDFRGPFPRGQLVQFDKCSEAVLEDFSCENIGDTSWPEDNINCYACINPVIRRGFIHGNNAPAGIGVLIENGEGGEGGLIQDVDVVYWANGAFSAADNSSGVTFERCRARDGIGPAATSTSLDQPDYRGQPIPSLETWVGRQVRGYPLSGQEPFFAYKTGQPDIAFIDCSYTTLPKAPNVAWDQDRMTATEFKEVDFEPRDSLKLLFPWNMAAAASPNSAGHSALGSRIDPSKPEDGIPAEKSVLRANLQAAKEEIETLQRGAQAWRIIEADYRLTPDDTGMMILVDSDDQIAITCSQGLHDKSGVVYPVKVVRWGKGSVSFVPEGDLALLSPGGRLTIPERYGVATLNILDGQTAFLEGV